MRSSGQGDCTHRVRCLWGASPAKSQRRGRDRARSAVVPVGLVAGVDVGYRAKSRLENAVHCKPVSRGNVMSQKPVRTSRIEARIAPDALKVVKRAAEIQ